MVIALDTKATNNEVLSIKTEVVPVRKLGPLQLGAAVHVTIEATVRPSNQNLIFCPSICGEDFAKHREAMDRAEGGGDDQLVAIQDIRKKVDFYLPEGIVAKSIDAIPWPKEMQGKPQASEWKFFFMLEKNEGSSWNKKTLEAAAKTFGDSMHEPLREIFMRLAEKRTREIISYEAKRVAEDMLRQIKHAERKKRTEAFDALYEEYKAKLSALEAEVDAEVCKIRDESAALIENDGLGSVSDGTYGEVEKSIEKQIAKALRQAIPEPRRAHLRL